MCECIGGTSGNEPGDVWFTSVFGTLHTMFFLDTVVLHRCPQIFAVMRTSELNNTLDPVKTWLDTLCVFLNFPRANCGDFGGGQVHRLLDDGR